MNEGDRFSRPASACLRGRELKRFFLLWPMGLMVFTPASRCWGCTSGLG